MSYAGSYGRDYDDAEFEELVGHTVVTIAGLDVGSAEVVLTTSSGKKAVLLYEPDCCAWTSIEDIVGDTTALLNTPLLKAEEVFSEERPAGREDDESSTWTFYHLSTVKGSVTIRWYGSSNGYYSETASFGWVKEGK